MNQENIKRGKGRPVGSNSFVRVRLCDLVNLIGSNATVPVSKVWLRENGFEEAVNAPLPPISFRVAEPEQEPEEKIEFSLTTFED
jgi:hypothetical protein